jgi:hypothetical protein
MRWKRDGAHRWAALTVAATTCSIVAGAGTFLVPPGGASTPGSLVFGPERRIGQAARNPSSPFLRVSPAGRLYAAWTEDDPSPGPQPKPTPNPAHRGHWMITFDMRVVLLASSGDGGATWGASRKVNAVTEAAQGEENEPKVAFAPDGRAIVVWSTPNDKGDKSRANVRFAMEDGKGGFAPSQTLNEVKDSARFPTMERGPDNSFFVTWIDRRVDGPTPRAVFMTRINPDGQVVGRSYKVGEDVCECCRLGLAFADRGRTVYLVHRGVSTEQIRNHVLRKSTDGGLTFGPPVTISDDGWQTGCPHSGPAIALDRRGHLHVAWFTMGRSPAEAGVYYSVSKDGGRSFAPRVLVHANTAPEVLHTALAVASDGAVHLAWDNLDETSRSQVFVRRLSPDGATWSPVQQISRASENARRPAVTLSDVALHVAWTESEGEASSIVLRSAALR